MPRFCFLNFDSLSLKFTDPLIFHLPHPFYHSMPFSHYFILWNIFTWKFNKIELFYHSFNNFTCLNTYKNIADKYINVEKARPSCNLPGLTARKSFSIIILILLRYWGEANGAEVNVYKLAYKHGGASAMLDHELACRMRAHMAHDSSSSRQSIQNM